MRWLNIVAFYSFISPFLFTFCIGLERLAILSASSLSHLHFYAKNCLFVFVTSTFLYLLFHFILSPLYLSFAFPIVLIVVLIFSESLIFSMYNSFISRKYTVANEERVFTFGTVILALYESSNYLELFSIVFLSFLWMFILNTFLFEIRRKVNFFTAENKWRSLPLLLITLGIISASLYFMDVFYSA